MALQRTKPIKERFRVIPSQTFVSFPSDLNTEKLKVVGYCQGNKINSKQPLKIAHFDSISFLRYSENEKDKKQFIHAIGYRENQKQLTILVLSYEGN